MNIVKPIDSQEAIDQILYKMNIKKFKEQPLYWTRVNKLNKTINAYKSKPHIVNGVVENPSGLLYCDHLQRLIMPNEDYQIEKDFDTEQYQVDCIFCGLALCRFHVVKGEKGSEEGILGFETTQHLVGYRLREDRLIGIQCRCGLADSRLSTKESMKYPSKFPVYITTSNEDEGSFGGDKFFTISKLT